MISLLEAESLETSAAGAVPGARLTPGSRGWRFNGWGWKLCKITYSVPSSELAWQLKFPIFN